MVKLKYENFKKIYEDLPPHLQELIISESTARIIFDISKKNNLSIDQTINLASSTGDILFGLRPVEQFLLLLKEKLNLPNEKIISIASEINQKIFFSVKHSLKNVYESTQKYLESINKEKKEEELTEIKKTISKNLEIKKPSDKKEIAKTKKAETLLKKEKPPKKEIPQQVKFPRKAELKKDILEELTK